MKNIIEYYYNTYVADIRMIENNYYFICNDIEYIFSLVKNVDEIEQIYKRSIETLNNNFFHTIILNKDKKLLTTINNNNYILLRINIKNNRYITFDDILFCSSLPIYNKDNINPQSLWQKKIDSFEYYIDYISDRKELYREYYDYFIGISETAVSYLTFAIENNTNEEPLCICHRRIGKGYTLYDLYNPLNIVVDHKSRDISEYIKTSIFNDEHIIDIDKIITNSNLSSYGFKLLISRMLLPTFFFDAYEGNEEDKNKVIKKIIYFMPLYEKLVSELIESIKKRTNVPSIKWLNVN